MLREEEEAADSVERLQKERRRAQRARSLTMVGRACSGLYRNSFVATLSTLGRHTPPSQSPMKVRLLYLVLVLPVSLWAAGPDHAKPSAFCAAAEAAAAPDPGPQLSADECSESLEPLARALQRANSITTPVSVRVVLQAPAPPGESERVRYDFDVFFYPFDANLSLRSLDKIDDVVERLNATWRIESFKITAKEDPIEAAVPDFRVAGQRAENLMSYLLAAGVPSDATFVRSTERGTHTNNEEGRARDRVAHVSVSALRRRGGDGSPHSPKSGSEASGKGFQELQAKEDRLIEKLQHEIAELSRLPKNLPENSEEARTREARRGAMQALLTKFQEQRMEDDRTLYVYPGIKDPLVERYYEDVRRRIEMEGTKNFPKKEGRSVYGKAFLQFLLLSDGTVRQVEVLRSNSADISDHAVGLLRSLTPFGQFPPELAAEVDRLVIIAPFVYAGGTP